MFRAETFLFRSFRANCHRVYTCSFDSAGNAKNNAFACLSWLALNAFVPSSIQSAAIMKQTMRIIAHPLLLLDALVRMSRKLHRVSPFGEASNQNKMEIACLRNYFGPRTIQRRYEIAICISREAILFYREVYLHATKTWQINCMFSRKRAKIVDLRKERVLLSGSEIVCTIN